jgi:hypothetical protein
MKNLKIFKILGILALVLAIASCSLEPVINSTVTNYPIMTLNGDETVFVELGSTYNDPGVIATENGAPITYTSKATGKYRFGKTLDTNIADQYVQTYTAVNKDGFSNTISRTVIVYKNGDLVNSIEGIYISTARRNGSLLPAAQGSSVDMEYVYIWKNTDGTYEISDAFGGWYDIGRNIGVISATQGGTITGNIPTNNFTFPGNPLTNEQFGGVANLTSITVSPGTKQVVVNCDWIAPPATSYKFVSTLIQFQP